MYGFFSEIKPDSYIKSKAFMAITEQTAIATVVKGSIRYFKYVYAI
ncbi:MAG: hypothetical protein RMX65_010235 [Nostoc sp. DedQUE01]|nr:hypothetical protein [Nostoc sp. DedQUE01]